jgi:hypothetical protein
MGTVVQLRPRALPPSPLGHQLYLHDCLIAAVEELYDLRTWIPRLHGPALEMALDEVARLERNKGRLESERIRLVGAELCVLKGGKGV